MWGERRFIEACLSDDEVQRTVLSLYLIGLSLQGVPFLDLIGTIYINP